MAATASTERRCARVWPVVAAVVLSLARVPSAGATAPATEGSIDRRVVALPPAVTGTLPAATREGLMARLVAGLGSNAVAVDGDAPACADAGCWQRLAAERNATYVVRPRFEVVERDYTVAAALVDAADGRVVAEATRTCEICGLQEVGDTVDDVATVLRRWLDAPHAQLPVLRIDSTPAGARVSLDGEDVGVTPLELTVAPGQHDVRVAKPGFVAQLQRITAVEGGHEAIGLQLPVLPAPERDRTGAARSMRIGGAVALGVGVAGIGVGIGLAVLDEAPMRSRCSGENIDIEGHCKYRYDSLGAGIGVLVGGAAALATGVALLVVAKRRSKPSRVAMVPSRGGLTLRF